MRRHIADDAHAFVTDVTSGYAQINVQGPRSRELLQALTTADLSNEAFPFRAAREIDIGFARVLCVRITYLGELGYELYIPAEQAMHVYDRLVAAGAAFGLRHAGLKALASLRMEKGYRDYGHDIDNTDSRARGRPRLRGRPRQARRLHRPRGGAGAEGGGPADPAAGPGPGEATPSRCCSTPRSCAATASPSATSAPASYGHTLGGAVGLAMIEPGVPIDGRVPGRRGDVEGRHRRPRLPGARVAAAAVRPDERPHSQLSRSVRISRRSPRRVGPTSRASTVPGFSRRQLMLVLGALIMAVMLASLDTTIIATALPTIAGEFNAFESFAWVGAAYIVAATIATPLLGKLSDLYGRRSVFQTTMAIFLVGSLLCGLSQSMDQLIASRAVQGLGGGAIQALAFAILGDILPPRERGRYIGYFTIAFAAAALMGPLIGGFIIDYFTWPWLFYINVPFCRRSPRSSVTSARLPFPRRKARLDVLRCTALVGRSGLLDDRPRAGR